MIDTADVAPGFGVYVHWPFCAAKCPYCDFNSHVRHQPVDELRFVESFKREIAHMRSLTGPREVSSLFFGGGTPSLMRPETVEAILNAVDAAWTVAAGAEITLEANPSSVDAGRFRGYRAAGVNRVSLGVQALNDDDLRFLGRLHSVSEALQAIDLARELFPRLSFDLIYARPGQTVADWAKELDRAIGYAVDHLSAYQLTIEQGTRFFDLHEAGRLQVPDGDLAADLYQATQEITTGRGLPAYEVSNHARPGSESRHNLTYWRYGDYVGLGAGAHGRISGANAKLATANFRMPETWLETVEEQGNGIESIERLEQETQADEMMLMGLRLSEGLDLRRWEALSRRTIDTEKEQFLTDLRFIERTGDGRLRCTPSGMMVLDAVVADLAM